MPRWRRDDVTRGLELIKGGLTTMDAVRTKYETHATNTGSVTLTWMSCSAHQFTRSPRGCGRGHGAPAVSALPCARHQCPRYLARTIIVLSIDFTAPSPHLYPSPSSLCFDTPHAARATPHAPRTKCSFDDIEDAYAQCQQLKEYIDEVRSLSDKHTVRTGVPPHAHDVIDIKCLSTGTRR